MFSDWGGAFKTCCKAPLVFCIFSLWGAFNVVLFNTVIFLMLISHLRAVVSDPGVVPLPKTNIDFSDMHSAAQKKDRVRHGFTFLSLFFAQKGRAAGFAPKRERKK